MVQFLKLFGLASDSGNCRPTPCVPLSPLSKYFLHHQWMLWLFLCWHREKKHLFSYLPPTTVSSRAKGERSQRPEAGVTPPACVIHPRPLFLQMVGCDYEIESSATEDRCGVCLGDGSACQTVRKMFKQKEGSGNQETNK